MTRFLLLFVLTSAMAVPALADDFRYDPIGKRDPFRGAVHVPDDGEAGPPGAVLGEFELSQLTLVAVAGAEDGAFAVVEAPTGPGALLTLGTVLGREGAVITHIDGYRVTARQERRLPDGTLLVVEHALALAETGVALPAPAPGP